ncbi:ORC1-type DNA replication protein [Methanofollis fontis]|uniref:ORC1-type DNA replication protein n=1 Tax=Methanofollis fontis TaxID=2052832 RepID=A0A483CZ37_9EURY|nr:ORC1-type DNA replication protein [Methanofollis fontis]TAJ45562.1 orc1/cdc6 family replication initiation protein [Methanofollis fontis]
MTSIPLMADQTLFRNPEVFEVTHLPETFNHRHAQMQELAFALRPTLDGGSPLNTVLRGPPGTGKTTAVHRIFAGVGEVCERVAPVLIPCHCDQTPRAVFARIYAALSGHPLPDAGVPLRRITERIADNLTGRGAVLVVCLDDAGELIPNGVLDDVLTALLRMHEGYPGTKAGVFLTLSGMDPDLSRCLTPSTLSVLHASEVFFPPYSRQEIRGILADRIRAGLYPGVVPPAVLDLMAERTDACGDLRVGLDMVRRAAGAAERAGRRAVTAEDVHAAHAASRHLRLEMAVDSLDAADREVLDAVLSIWREGEEETRSGTVYERLCDRDAMSYSAFYSRLRKLEHLRLVDIVMWRGRGNSRMILPGEGVEEAMEGAFAV